MVEKPYTPPRNLILTKNKNETLNQIKKLRTLRKYIKTITTLTRKISNVCTLIVDTKLPFGGGYVTYLVRYFF